MNCLTKLSQKKRVTKSYIRAFLATMISKRDSSDKKTTLRDIIDINDNNPSLRLTKFERERIQFHFDNCKNSERVKHDNSKYAPNTKKGKYGVFSYQKPDGSLRFHVGDAAKTQIQDTAVPFRNHRS